MNGGTRRFTQTRKESENREDSTQKKEKHIKTHRAFPHTQTHTKTHHDKLKTETENEARVSGLDLVCASLDLCDIQIWNIKILTRRVRYSRIRMGP